MKSRRVLLISPIGGRAMYGIVEYFKKKNFEVVGIDANDSSIGKVLVDHFEVVPRIGEQYYAEKVISIIKQYDVDLFISWLDEEILFWNEYFLETKDKKLMKKFAFNFRKDLIDFYDKYKFSLLLSQANLPHPKTFLLDEKNSFYDFNFPIIIKPRRGSGSKNIKVVESLELFECAVKEIEYKVGDLSNYILQEFIKGEEYTIDFFSLQGEIVNIVVRKRIKHAGVSLIGEIVYDTEIEELVRKFVYLFKIDGLNNIQVIKASDKIFILEANLRPSGTIVFSVEAGVDLLNNLIEKFSGKKITKYGKPKKLRMIRFLREYYYGQD